MFNLTKVLPAEDKEKIKKYITLFGTDINFIGADEWLQWWGIEKIKLYKLLGNKFIHYIDFEYTKNDEEVEDEIYKKLILKYQIGSFYYHFLNTLSQLEMALEIDYKTYVRLSNLCGIGALFSNRVIDDCVLSYVTPEGKTKKLQIQKGSKTIKIIKKLLDFLKDFPVPASVQESYSENINEALRLFDDWRMEHSRIISDRIIKAKLCFSIHPLDFMTMSDNQKWISCMNWRKKGCYRVGTVEMMNSNNVICVYLTTSEPFNFVLDNNHGDFDFDEKEDYYKTKEYEWNNKRWRQLIYLNKDIIVSGKSYPYANDMVSKLAIEELRKLAKENLNWEYEYGIELYQDMKHINGNYSMERAKEYIDFYNKKAIDFIKHNILFDTKGMYNDMVNVPCYNYYCVRNKVKKSKVISISGKANCLCCGNQIIRKLDEDEYCIEDYWVSSDYYNARYAYHENLVCADCEVKNWNDKRKKQLEAVRTVEMTMPFPQTSLIF